MKIKDRLLMALRNLSRRKSRTILTVLSVVIGATSIILMLAFASGISNSQKEMLDSFGGLNTISIVSNDQSDEIKVTETDIKKLKNVDGVSLVIPSKMFWAELKVDGENEYALGSSYEVVPDEVFSKLESEDFEFGSAPTKSDTDKILLGPQASIEKMSPMPGGGYMSEPMDQDFSYSDHKYDLRLGYKDEEDDGVNFGEEANEDRKKDYVDIPVKISGKLNSKAPLKGWSAFVNEAFFEKIKKEDDKLQSPTLNEGYDDKGQPIIDKSDKVKYNRLKVVVGDIDRLEEVNQSIRDLGFKTQSEAGSLDEIEKQTTQVSLILGGIGSVAFIVSAIGIINTMLMSIYERKKEIGVMKVIGASVNDIRSLFLIESGFIGFFGGVLGLFISLAIARLINSFVGQAGMFGTGGDIISISPLLAILGVGFSSLVGVIAGYMPARRATKISAIEALRSD